MAVLATIGVAIVVSGATPASGIGVTTFSMSPASGPGGTTVSVSGAGCAPGLLLSSSQDRVVVTLASVPAASVQIPVSSGGGWSGSVTVPGNAAAGSAPVTALCLTDGLQSLLTIYSPQTFTVTAGPTAPTTQPVTTTVPAATHQPTATLPPPTGGPTPTTRPGSTPTTQPAVGGGGPVGGPGGGSSTPGGGTAGPASPGGSGASPGARHQGAPGTRAGTVSVAADLRSPNLASADVAADGRGLGWIGWLALALLLAGLAGGGLLFRRYRAGEAPAAA
jgi:hypothetical protein